MRLVNEVRLDVPVARAWEALLDVPRVAAALPGASVEPEAGADGHRGRMKVKLGPASAEYAGVAALQDVDDDTHTASYRVRGREVHGQGEARAVIHVSAAADGAATRVRVETELEVSGRQAQLGRGLMEEVAAGTLAAFAGRLSDALSGRGAPADSQAVEAFDAGRVLLRPLLERAAFALAGLVAGVLLGRVVWRRS
jgi:carbon monoxide dehydrogenase subunit G